MPPLELEVNNEWTVPRSVDTVAAARLELAGYMRM